MTDSLEPKVQDSSKNLPVKPKRSKRSKEATPKVVVSLPTPLKTVDFEGMTIACSDQKKVGGVMTNRFDFSRYADMERKESGSNTGDLKTDCPLLYQLLVALSSDGYKRQGLAWSHLSRKTIFDGFRYVLPFAYQNDLVPLNSRVLTVELWGLFIKQWRSPTDKSEKPKSASTFRLNVGRFLGVLVASGDLEDKYTRTLKDEKDTESELLLLSQKEIRSSLRTHPYKVYERDLKHRVKAIFERWDYVMQVIKTQKDPRIQMSPRRLSFLGTNSTLDQYRVGASDFDAAIQRIARERGEKATRLCPPSPTSAAQEVPITYDPNCLDENHLALHRQLLCKGLASLRQDPFVVKKTSDTKTYDLSVFEDVTNIVSSTNYTLAQSIWAAHMEFKELGVFCGVDAIKAPLARSKSVLHDGASMLVPDAPTKYVLLAYLGIKTGWNLETLSSIPVDLNSCMEEVSSKDPGIVKIWAYKGRSRRDQYVIDNLFSKREVFSQNAKKKSKVVFKKTVHKESLNHVGYVLTKIREYLQFLNDYLFDVGLDNPNRRLLEHYGIRSKTWKGFSYTTKTDGEAVTDRTAPSQAAKTAGLKGFSLQLARKLYAEYLALETNFDIRKIQSRLGHRSPILSYISRVVFKVHGQLRLSDFQKIIVDRLGNGRDVDPTLLKNHWINRKTGAWMQVEETIKKHRAQAGQVCETGYKIRDKDEQLRDCESGRCALCKHGLIDDDSWAGMSKRLAEIVFLMTESGMGMKALEAHRIIDEQDRLLANLFVHFQARVTEIQEVMHQHFEQVKARVEQNSAFINNLIGGI